MTRSGGTLQVELDERHKYMLLLDLSSRLALKGVPDLKLKLRVYLDARVAEVIGYQGASYIPPRYQSSVNRGELRDERQQLNRMLFELLKECRQAPAKTPESLLNS